MNFKGQMGLGTIAFSLQFEFAILLILIPWLAKDLGMDISLLGTLFLVQNLAIALFHVIAGYIFDMSNSKVTSILSMVGLILFPVALSQVNASSAVLFICLFFIFGAAYSTLSVQIASLYSLLSEGKSGKSWGFYYFLFYGGYAVGPLITAGLLKTYSITAALMVSGLIFVPCLFIMVFFPMRRIHSTSDNLLDMFRSLSFFGSSRTILFRLIAFGFITALAWGMVGPYIPLITDAVGMDRSLVSLLYTGSAVLASGVSLLSGRITDRFSPVAVIMLGVALGTGEILCLLKAEEPILVALAFVFGSFYILSTPPLRSIMSLIFTEETRGRAFGIFGAFSSIGNILGPKIGSYIWSLYSYTAILWIALTLLFCAVLVAYSFPHISTEAAEPSQEE
jgi:DHA1 family multidrug resistance protein-like MFS transporter